MSTFIELETDAHYSCIMLQKTDFWSLHRREMGMDVILLLPGIGLAATSIVSQISPIAVGSDAATKDLPVALNTAVITHVAVTALLVVYVALSKKRMLGRLMGGLLVATYVGYIGSSLMS